MRLPSILLALLLTSVTACNAQNILDYFKNADVGVSLSYYRITGRHQNDKTETISANYLAGSWTGGVYVPVVSLEADMSVGITTALSVDAGYTPDYKQAILGLHAPLVVMLKHGTDAQFFGKIRDGFGAGLGYRFQLLFLVFEEKESVEYGTQGPVGVLEYSHIRDNGTLVKLRLYGTLGAISSEIDKHNRLLTDIFNGHLNFSAVTLSFTWISSFQ